MLQEVVKNKNIYLVSFIVSFLSILIAAWLGIFTRPLSNFAFFWPANAILLGLLICFPAFRNIATFLGSLFAYLLADLSTGSGLIISIVLTMGNYISIGLTLVLFLYLSRYLSYLKPNDYYHILPYFLSILIATGISSIFMVLVLPYIPDSFIKSNSFVVILLNWWSAELFNYALILPLFTSFPKNKWAYFVGHHWSFKKYIHFALPLILITFLIILTNNFFSPVALLYPLVGLIWAACVYRFFPLTLICLVVGLTLYHSLSNLNFHIENHYVVHPMISIRIGLLIIILCTLVIGIMNTYRRRLYNEINYFNHFDLVTYAMHKESFFQVSKTLIENKRQYPLSFVKIEIDQLQKIHDKYGISGVGQVLDHFIVLIRNKLRSEDLFCRTDNDEFILLIRKLPLSDVLDIAKRIQAEIKTTEIKIIDNDSLNISICLGIAHYQSMEEIHIEQAMSDADKALHQAKMQGFNQINVHKKSETAI